MRQRVTLPDFVIASSGSESGVLDLEVAGREQPAGFAVYGPATLTGTITVEWSPDGTTWHTLRDGGADVTIGAGDVVVVDFPLALAKAMRIVSSGTEAAERTFKVIAYEQFA